MPVNGEKFGDAKGTLTGVEQIGEVDPYSENYFHTSAWQGGISVIGSGDTTVFYNRGDWTGVSGVKFSKGAKSITITAGSDSGATIRISTDSPQGYAIGYITIPRGDVNSFKKVTGEILSIYGSQNIFFTASGGCHLKSYKFDA